MAIIAQGLTGSAQPNLLMGDLDFHDIRNNLKNYLAGSGVFTDYDFEGSAMSTILDVLAYNTSLYGYYANMIANESFLDTAQKVESIMSLAKSLSYIPNSRRVSTAEITVNGTDKTITEKNMFLGEGLKWSPTREYYVNGDTTIEIFQGYSINHIHPQGYDTNTPFRKYEIPSEFIDTTTLKIFVDEGSGFNEWKGVDNLVGNIAGVTAGQQTYFLTPSSHGKYSIYFGDNIIGKKPQNLSSIKMNFKETSGEDGNGVVKFTSGTDGISVVKTVVGGAGGAFREGIESIRRNAPLNFQTQGRYVTSSDYEVGLKQEYGISLNVWGGEEDDPPNYGRVYVSAVDSEGSLLTRSMKSRIISSIKEKNVVTILPEFVDPILINVLVEGEIFFNSVESSNTITTIGNRVKKYINSYQILSFDDPFNHPIFTNKLRLVDEGIVGENLSVCLEKIYDFESDIIDPNKDGLMSITLPFRNALANPGGIPGTVIETPKPFKVIHDGTTITVYLIDDGFSGIRMYRLDNSSFIKEVGSINYSSGRVQIDNLNAIQNFTIRARPRSSTIIAKGPLVLTTKDGGVQLIPT